MTSVEKTARSVEEAIEAALSELGAARDEVEIEVLQEPSRSFLGILGHSEAKVRVSLREPAEEPAQRPAPVEPSELGRKAQDYLAAILAETEIPTTVELVGEDEEEIALDIKGEDLGLLIGRHGQTLGALQLLVAVMTNKGQEQTKRVVVDAQGYRARREEALRAMAYNAARKAQQTGRDVILEDLGPNERRIVHTTLADEERISTRSIGEDPYRKIVVSAPGVREEPHPYRPRRPREEPRREREQAPTPEEPPEDDAEGGD